MGRDTLRTLIAVSRSKPVERELCCPECDSDVALGGPGDIRLFLYFCPACLSEFESLAELAVREERSDG